MVVKVNSGVATSTRQGCASRGGSRLITNRGPKSKISKYWPPSVCTAHTCAQVYIHVRVYMYVRTLDLGWNFQRGGPGPLGPHLNPPLARTSWECSEHTLCSHIYEKSVSSRRSHGETSLYATIKFNYPSEGHKPNTQLTFKSSISCCDWVPALVVLTKDAHNNRQQGSEYSNASIIQTPFRWGPKTGVWVRRKFRDRRITCMAQHVTYTTFRQCALQL